MADKLTFRERPLCPCCGSGNSQALWAGRFDEPGIAAFLTQYHYSGDWQSGLGNAPFELLKCNDCGMKWHRHVLDDAGLYTLYAKWADAEQARRFEAAHAPDKHDKAAQRAQMAKLILRLQHLTAQHGSPPRLLDFGCGDGDLLRVARSFGLEATGVDMSASRSEAARREGLTIYPDLETLSEADPTPFDAIVMSQVLEHLDEPNALLASLRARLKPGGILFVAVPNTEGVGIPQDFHQFTLVQPVEHINAFTPASLRTIVARHGFRPVRRPSAFLTTRAGGVLRSAMNWIWQPRTTDVFFRLDA